MPSKMSLGYTLLVAFTEDKGRMVEENTINMVKLTRHYDII
jgi:hypothetical protein